MSAPDRALVIVGAGPAGLYAARAALTSGRFSKIDVIERLPAPYGLVRYGVAPDHADTKRVTKVFDAMFDTGRVRFLGNVTIGRDVSHAQLREHYDAVVYATGVSGPRRLRVPGAQLPGSVSAAEFVSWYSGHPDARAVEQLRSARTVTVIGGGNVALDVARLLAATDDTLRTSDMPQPVLEMFLQAQVDEIHIVVRRGPAHTRFSPVELAQLDRVPGLQPRVDPCDVDRAVDEAGLSPAAERNLAIFRSWTTPNVDTGSRCLHFHFWTAPTAIRGDGVVRSVDVAVDAPGRTMHSRSLRADLVVHCIGFNATVFDGLRATVTTDAIAHLHGRVQAPNGEPMTGVYVTGWLKRGPSGTIATNRRDAEETVSSALEDLAWLPRRRDRSDILTALVDAGVHVVPWPGWCAIRAQEELGGRRRGSASVKLSDRDQMLAIAARSPSAVPSP